MSNLKHVVKFQNGFVGNHGRIVKNANDAKIFDNMMHDDGVAYEKLGATINEVSIVTERRVIVHLTMDQMRRRDELAARRQQNRLLNSIGLHSQMSDDAILQRVRSVTERLTTPLDDNE